MITNYRERMIVRWFKTVPKEDIVKIEFLLKYFLEQKDRPIYRTYILSAKETTRYYKGIRYYLKKNNGKNERMIFHVYKRSSL